VKCKGQFSLVDVFNLKAKWIGTIETGNVVGEACGNMFRPTEVKSRKCFTKKFLFAARELRERCTE
jgi:hypothetical protein